MAEDVKFTYDRFLTEPGNPNRYILEPVDRIEVVDRYTVKFLLKEPYVWLVSALAYSWSMWLIAPEVVQQFGDLKKPESSIGTGPFLLEHYEPNVKTVFKRNPAYFRQDQPYVDGVEWLQTWPRHPCHQWGLKTTGLERGTDGLFGRSCTLR